VYVDGPPAYRSFLVAWLLVLPCPHAVTWLCYVVVRFLAISQLVKLKLT
jgi:hypothetical protein